MRDYKVVARLKHDGVVYEPGDSIELTYRQAKAMPWAVKLVPARATKEEKTPKAPEKENGGKK